MQDIALGISASGPSPSIAVRLPDGSVTVAHPSAGTDRLVSTIHTTFADHGLAPGDLRELRLDLGPGSYTGLRVAVTFARTIHAYGGVTVLTATSLELSALAAWTEDPSLQDRRLRPVLDARRDRFHHAGIELRETAVTVDSPRATSREELFEAVGDGEAILADPALHPLLQAVGDRAQLLTLRPWDSRLLFDPRLQRVQARGEDLEPLYLMGSYAE